MAFCNLSPKLILRDMPVPHPGSVAVTYLPERSKSKLGELNMYGSPCDTPGEGGGRGGGKTHIVGSNGNGIDRTDCEYVRNSLYQDGHREKGYLGARVAGDTLEGCQTPKTNVKLRGLPRDVQPACYRQRATEQKRTQIHHSRGNRLRVGAHLVPTGDYASMTRA